MLLIFFHSWLISTPNNQSFVVLQTLHIIADFPVLLSSIVLSFCLLVIYLSCFFFYSCFSSDEKELGEDEGPTQELERETQSEEQSQQQQEEEEGEAVVQEEEEVGAEQSHSAPGETESQPS